MRQGTKAKMLPAIDFSVLTVSTTFSCRKSAVCSRKEF